MNHFEAVQRLIVEGEKTARTDEQSFGSSMFRHLIELMGEVDFNNTFEAYFLHEEPFDEAFFDFHKSMRQCDFFNDFYKKIKQKTVEGKPSFIQKNIGGHLDMLFWNFIQISDIPYLILKRHHMNCVAAKIYAENIGKKVSKCSIGEQSENGKKFKSGLTENTVKDVVMHEHLTDEPAYTFVEDDSVVECRRCKII